MTPHTEHRKHVVFVSLPFWGHLRGLICFAAHLLTLDESLVITFFNHATWKKQTDELVKETALSKEQLARFRVIMVGSPATEDPLAPIAEVPQLVLKEYFEPLTKGEAVGGYDAAPPPSAIVADFFAHPVLDHAKQVGFKSRNFLFVVCEPGGLHMKTRQVLGDEETLQVNGHPPLHKHEFAVSTGPFPHEMVAHIERAGFESFTSGHSLLLFWSRKLAPESAMAWDAEMKAKGATCLVLEPQYHPTFWEPVPSSWPKSDPVFDWLDKQEKQSVVFISWGSAFFPVANPWQVDVLLDSLIAAKKPFILNLNSPTTAMLGDKKKEWEGRASQSGNLATGWLDQPLTLKHPALGLVLTHGGANTTLEALIMGLPLVFWPFAADQPGNASLLVHQLDAAFELLETRDLAKGKKLANHPGYTIHGTPESLRKELDELWTRCAGAEGQRKRSNAQRLGQILRQEHAECGEAYAREFLDQL